MMAPCDDFRKAIEDHGNWKQMLEEVVFCDQSNYGDEKDWHQSSCEFGIWLQSTKHSPLADDKCYQQLIELHEAYHKALKTVFGLYEKNSPEQARQCFEGEFKEKSLKLTAEMLRWIARLNQEELERNETL